MKKWPMPPDVAVDVIKRDNGTCVVCGIAITGQGHIHHRQPRGMGGGGMEAHNLSNLIYLHPSCHLQHVEEKRENAYRNGWLLERWQDPAETPLMYRLDGYRLLTDMGDVLEVEIDRKRGTWELKTRER